MGLTEEILTLKETSQYLKVSSESLRSLIKRREIPAARVGNQWRFKKSLIDQWINQQCEYYVTPVVTKTIETALETSNIITNHHTDDDFDEIL